MISSKKKEPSELPFRYGSSDGVVYPSTSSDSNKKISAGQSIEEYKPSEFNTKFSPKMKAKSVLADSFLRLGCGRSKVYHPDYNDGFEPIIIENFDGLRFRNPDRFGFTSRAERVFKCGTSLTMAYGIYDTGEIEEKGRLVFANFCRDRLCPMCNWRRSLKIYGQASQIMDVIASKYQFLFLTLTVPNCARDALKETLDNMNDGFYRMKRSKRFSSVVKGFHRVLEVTINQENETYHPHFHVILAVEKGYLSSKNYITHAEWLKMWQDAMNDSNIKMVNIKAIKPKLKDGHLYDKSMHDAVAEVSKYAVKSADFLGKFDKNGNLIKPFSNEIIDNRVYILANALRGRQLSVFGGVFRDILKTLKLDDAENGDLIHVQKEKYNPFIAELIIRFGWRAGIGEYVKYHSAIVTKEEVRENAS